MLVRRSPASAKLTRQVAIHAGGLSIARLCSWAKFIKKNFVEILVYAHANFLLEESYSHCGFAEIFSSMLRMAFSSV